MKKEFAIFIMLTISIKTVSEILTKYAHSINSVIAQLSKELKNALGTPLKNHKYQMLIDQESVLKSEQYRIRNY
jgi:hypothetical protein